MAKCYLCNNDSTGVEHTPPKCFFPVGMRDNLITVPSCDVHNQDTSVDDEYARNMMTMSIENNQVSVNHFFDKSLRSLKRNPRLAEEIRNSLKDVAFYKIDAKAFMIDRPRFDRIIRKVAYALFYDEFGYTWEKLLAVTTNQLRMSGMELDHLGEVFESLSDEIDQLTLKGNNPQIFQYVFVDSGPGKFDKGLFMLFYEGFPFWIIPVAESDHCDLD